MWKPRLLKPLLAHKGSSMAAHVATLERPGNAALHVDRGCEVERPEWGGAPGQVSSAFAKVTEWLRRRDFRVVL